MFSDQCRSRRDSGGREAAIEFSMPHFSAAAAVGAIPGGVRRHRAERLHVNRRAAVGAIPGGVRRLERIVARLRHRSAAVGAIPGGVRRLNRGFSYAGARVAAVGAIPGGVRRKSRCRRMRACASRSRRDSGGREAGGVGVRSPAKVRRSRRDSGGREAAVLARDFTRFRAAVGAIPGGVRRTLLPFPSLVNLFHQVVAEDLHADHGPHTVASMSMRLMIGWVQMLAHQGIRTTLSTSFKEIVLGLFSSRTSRRATRRRPVSHGAS